MKKIGLLLLGLFGASCRETPAQPFPPQIPLGQVVAYVYWNNAGIPGRQIVLVEIAETTFTDKSGFANFSVPAGHYTLRAFGINRGGPCCGLIDFGVDARVGDTARVNIFDCLECL